MKRVIFTLEAENFDDFQGVELNFKNKDKYDYTTESTYDAQGNPLRLVTEYTYKEDKE